MKLTIRKIHKYLSLFISLQLLLWTISGIYFAYNKIEMIRGEHLRNLQNGQIVFNLQDFPKLEASSISAFIRLGHPVLKIQTTEGIIYKNTDGLAIEPIDSIQAMEIVDTKTSLNSISAEEIFETPRGSEYRGRSLPLFQVKTDHRKNINAYVDAMTGEIVAIRSSGWRIWDFMWGLHIMDYIERDNINNLLMKIFSVLALISSLSGVVLFFTTQKKATS